MKFNAAPSRQNVLYSLIEFGSLPVLMLTTAPVLLKALGQQQYGTWMLVNSVAATAGGLGGGFGEAATRFIAYYRGRADELGITRSFLAVLLINCLLGGLSAGLVIICAPWLLNHVFQVGPALYLEALVAVRIAGVLLAIRFPISVFVSATRACEHYRPMVLITVLSRTVLIRCGIFGDYRLRIDQHTCHHSSGGGTRQHGPGCSCISTATSFGDFQALTCCMASGRILGFRGIYMAQVSPGSFIRAC